MERRIWTDFEISAMILSFSACIIVVIPSSRARIKMLNISPSLSLLGLYVVYSLMLVMPSSTSCGSSSRRIFSGALLRMRWKP